MKKEESPTSAALRTIAGLIALAALEAGIWGVQNMLDGNHGNWVIILIALVCLAESGTIAVRGRGLFILKGKTVGKVCGNEKTT